MESGAMRAEERGGVGRRRRVKEGVTQLVH